MKKIKYLLANLMAPGIGLFAMKRWIRGIIYFFSAASCFLWMVISFSGVMIGNLYNAMEDKELDSNSLGIFLPMFLFVSIWMISYIDLLFFCKPLTVKETKEENDN